MSKKKPKKTDYERVMKMATLTGVKTAETTDKEMIYSDAVKLGAVKAVSFLTKEKGGLMDFNFDKKDNLVGTNSESTGSFTKAPKYRK